MSCSTVVQGCQWRPTGAFTDTFAISHVHKQRRKGEGSELTKFTGKTTICKAIKVKGSARELQRDPPTPCPPY